MALVSGTRLGPVEILTSISSGNMGRLRRVVVYAINQITFGSGFVQVVSELPRSHIARKQMQFFTYCVPRCWLLVAVMLFIPLTRAQDATGRVIGDVTDPRLER